MLRSLLPFVLLAAMAAMSTWYLGEIESGLERERAAGSEAPRAFGTGIAFIRLGEDGRPKFRLEASGIAKGPGESGTDLVAPQFTGYLGERVVRRGRAERGWLAEERDLVRLFDHVTLEKLDTRDGVPAVLSTAYLEFYPKDGIAETDRAVRIVTGSAVLEAIGMRTDLERDRVLFKSRVRGRHYPKRTGEEP